MPRKPKPTPPGKPVTSHTHLAKRANIPTEELRDFVADEEKAPKTLLYPRDPSLDPQAIKEDPKGFKNPSGLVPLSGEARKDKDAKTATARTLWVPAVNNHTAIGAGRLWK